MANLVGRKASLIRLHTTAHVTGFGNLTSIIRAEPKDGGRVELSLVQEGVYFSYVKNVTKVEALIPYGNIASVEFAQE